MSSIQGARLAAAAMPQHERHAEISELVMDAALRSSTVHHAFMQGRYMREWQVRNGQSDDHLKVMEWPDTEALVAVLASHAPHEVAMQQLVSLLPDEVYSRLFHESFSKDLGYVSNDGVSICESLFGIEIDVKLQEAIRSAVLRTASEMKGAEDTLRMANIQKVYAEDASTRPGARPPEPSRDGMPSKYDGRAIGENTTGARSGLERTTWVGMAAASDCLSTSELSDVLIQGAYQGAVLVQEQLAIAVKGLWNFDECTLRQALDILPESPQKELVSALAEAYIEQYNLTVANVCALLEKESLKDALESLDPVYYQRSVAQREEILAARLVLYRYAFEGDLKDLETKSKVKRSVNYCANGTRSGFGWIE